MKKGSPCIAKIKGFCGKADFYTKLAIASLLRSMLQYPCKLYKHICSLNYNGVNLKRMSVNKGKGKCPMGVICRVKYVEMAFSLEIILQILSCFFYKCHVGDLSFTLEGCFFSYITLQLSEEGKVCPFDII